VRTDYIVGPGTWEFQPTAFNRPGLLPPDAINLPEKERSADANKLKEFVGKKVLDPNTIPAADRAEYAKLLEEMFGTPAHPKVSGFEPAALKSGAEAANVDPAITADAVVQALRLDPATLAEGSRHFRQHCMHCHGMEG